jgi:hypothetical protein
MPFSEKAVIDLVEIRKVINGFPVLVLIVNANLVVQDGMESDVAELCDFLYFSKIASIAVA